MHRWRLQVCVYMMIQHLKQPRELSLLVCYRPLALRGCSEAICAIAVHHAARI